MIVKAVSADGGGECQKRRLTSILQRRKRAIRHTDPMKCQSRFGCGACRRESTLCLLFSKDGEKAEENCSRLHEIIAERVVVVLYFSSLFTSVLYLPIVLGGYYILPRKMP